MFRNDKQKPGDVGRAIELSCAYCQERYGQTDFLDGCEIDT